MAPNADQPLIAALDIGSSKVSALIAARDGEDRIRVLGTGQRESRGVKRGYITDIEKSEFAVREAVEEYAHGAEYHVPMPAVLTSGVRGVRL